MESSKPMTGGVTSGSGTGHLGVEFLDRFSQTNTSSFRASLLLSSLVVFVLWDYLPHGGLLAWLFAVWVGQSAHEAYSHYYRKHRDIGGADYGRWLYGFWLAAAAVGVCWSIPFFLFGAATNDAVLLLVFVIVAVTAYGGVARATVLSVALIFEAATLLPMCVWLFQRDSGIYRLMGGASLLYLAMLIPLLRKMNQMMTRSFLLGGENRRLSSEQKGYLEKLHRSEEEYRTLASNMPVAVIRYDAGQRRCYINPAAERMLHGQAGNMLGQLPGEGGVPATPAMIERYRSVMTDVLETGEIREFEFALDALPEGTHEHYQIRMAPEHGEDGRVSGALAIWFDVTERNRMEEELRLKEQVLDHAHDGIYLIDEQARFVYVNDEACRALGYSREELLGMGVQDIDQAYSVEDTNAVGRQTREDGSFVFQTQHRRRDGSLLPVEIQASALEYQGQHLGLAVARDISERKQAEAALESSNMLLRNVLQGIPDPVWMKDANGVFVVCNQGVARLFNMPVEEIIGKDDFDFFPPEEAEFYRNKDRSALEAGQVLVNEEWWTFGDNGEQVLMETRKTPVRSTEGKLLGVLGVARDITARKRLETELAARERVFRTLAENMPDNVVRWDKDGRYVYLNRTLEHVLGKRLDQISGQRPSEAFTDGRFEPLQTAVEKLVSSEGGTVIVPLTLQTGDGQMVFHEVKLVAERNDAGEVVGVLGIGRDMTEIKRIEESLRRSERLMRTVIDATPDWIFVKDRHHRYQLVNKSYAAALKIPPEDFIGKDGLELGFPEEQVKGNPAKGIRGFWADDELVLGSNSALVIPDHAIAVDGEVRTFHATKVPLCDDEKAPWGVLAFVRDITEHKQAQAMLQERYDRIVELHARLEEDARTLEEQAVELEASKEQLMRTEAWYRGILQSAPDGMVVVDGQGLIRLVNTQLCRMFGYEDGELTGQPIELLVPFDTRGSHEALRSGFIESGAPGRPMGDGASSLRGCRKDGSEFFIDVCLARLPKVDDAIGTVCAAIRDVTERKQLEQALAKREQEFRTLVENSVDKVARYGRDLRRLYVNPAFAALVKGGADALIGRTPTECPGGPNAAIYENKLAEVFAEGRGTEFESKWTDRTGQEMCSLISLTPEFDAQGEVSSVLSVGRDITELNAFRHKIHQMAFYDPLTSLPNRALFNDRLRQMITDAAWHGQQAGLMMMDMDRFKAVNDTLGHPAGDELLRETAARLSTCVRAYDTVARLGGDEFAILLPEVRSGDDLGRIASKVLAVFQKPFQLAGKEVFVSCSIGIALYPGDSTEADDLLKYADSAMYFAKRSGRNNFRFYSRDLTESSHERLVLESDLRRALEREELELFYQPKVSLRDGELTGSEALLRWRHPERGMVPPNAFIGIAEDSGLIVEIGEWVLREACRTASRWNGEGKPLHKVAINLSPRQFQGADLAGMVFRALEESACRPEWIELEITESLLLAEENEVLDVLNSFRAKGISIAIDDFGTGYSALSYLARFPIATLKIDRSFISSIATDTYRAELVKAILSIARCLGQQVVAEGVETLEQAEFLKAHGCHVAQGYFYGKPMPASEFERLSNTWFPVLADA